MEEVVQNQVDLLTNENSKYSVIMPPKRKNAVSVDKAVVETEASINDITKKRGKRVEKEPVEDVDVAILAEPKGQTKKLKTKIGTKSAKAAPEEKHPDGSSVRTGRRNVKAPEENSVELKHVKTVKEKAKSEEKVMKKTAKNEVEKIDENKEKPVVKKQKKESGDTKKTEAKAKEKPKAKAPNKAEVPPKNTKKAEGKTALLNLTETKWDAINFDCSKQNPKGEHYNLKITSWNVDGIRAWVKKDGLNILKYDSPDILCLQETKCGDDKLPEEVKSVEEYYDFWCSSDKEGYAGVGVYTKREPLNVKSGIDAEEHDNEGRCLTLEYSDFYLVNVYVPNAGRGLVTLDKRLEWNEAFKAYIKELDDKKPVILCGDMNVAHNEIDLSNPKTNKKNAGFTQEEREGLTDFLADGYVDSFRALYPDTTEIYTFWSYMKKARSKNIGWRLDYFILSEGLLESVCDSVARPQVYGSDHCPITLFINI